MADLVQAQPEARLTRLGALGQSASHEFVVTSLPAQATDGCWC